ncbi:glycoside hydrolase family 97 protein [Saccharopolyspora erythraea]|uniref:glycoside hydrolase family 97 protein n=1 Tax=Saccharopolyspora erythraea TaxID=1836 RepID=UPI001BAA1B2F|nr:glycoside hydrolase family 97 protein [Saccharopolyspora erythraea]QUH03240.1 glycoside hydrolase family 97 protein [Saccharopolyspora erythraea]
MSEHVINRRTFAKATGLATGMLGVASWVPATAAHAAGEPVTTTSPDGSVSAHFRVRAGRPEYSVGKSGRTVIDWSRLGFELGDGGRLGESAELEAVARHELDETWHPVWGSASEIRSHCAAVVLRLRETTEPVRHFEIEFRVFDDGVGFRHVFPDQRHLGDFEVLDELTEFRFTADHTAWSSPANYDSVEYLYSQTPLTGAGVVHEWQEPRGEEGEKLGTLATPLAVRVADDIYLGLHEAALLNYPDMTLAKIDGGPHLRSALVPRKGEGRVKARLRAPFPTPWRALIIGDRPGALVESHLVLNLNEPCAIEDTSWIAPGKFVGVWWEIHKGRNTWTEGPDLGATTENTIRCIDFAAENGIPYVLAEGWNEGWESDGFGDRQNFTKANAQFDLRRVVDHARQRGVAFLAHNETGGGIDNYERQLDDAFALYERLGMPGVKTGYAGDIKEHYHHDQWMVNHYQRVIHKAAQHRLMINAHEPIKGTGIERTYPNFVSREAARGIEYDAWSRGNPPEHTVTLPFTVMLAGPLDYTPGIFDITWFPEQSPEDSFGAENDRTRVHTTRAHQIALYPVLLSGLQQLADVPENYRGAPEFEFLREVPVTWDETRVVQGEIGDYITMARRSGDRWFVGSLTDEQERVLDVPLDFLGAGAFVAHVYADAPETDLDTNPNAVRIDRWLVDSAAVVRAELTRGGGHAMRIVPATDEDRGSLRRYPR